MLPGNRAAYFRFGGIIHRHHLNVISRVGCALDGMPVPAQAYQAEAYGLDMLLHAFDGYVMH